MHNQICGLFTNHGIQQLDRGSSQWSLTFVFHVLYYWNNVYIFRNGSAVNRGQPNRKVDWRWRWRNVTPWPRPNGTTLYAWSPLASYHRGFSRYLGQWYRNHEAVFILISLDWFMKITTQQITNVFSLSVTPSYCLVSVKHRLVPWGCFVGPILSRLNTWLNGAHRKQVNQIENLIACCKFHQ